MPCSKHVRWHADSQGYLIDPDDWTAEIARRIADSESVDMTDDHWKVINFIRAWYAGSGLAADLHAVIRYLAEALGCGGAAKSRLYELFPRGYTGQACKIAGMRRPGIWRLAVVPARTAQAPGPYRSRSRPNR